ncbi:OLC1v1032594C1 [Oldenlandia corymbosa var. corymbosa]|uniref:OLC1v1032594C1 n=1 Tax=Oldenlandia corymbosa var. corymbosa TaxID=529605 RepID=A0AAV1CN05_OLDCO|nr:OLC1v1032594C1 [Oldenlandia corymbosa var. corymbosa]
MASLSFAQFSSLPRWQSWNFSPSLGIVELPHVGMRNKWTLAAVSKRKVKEALAHEVSEDIDVVETKSSRKPKRSTGRTRKKAGTEDPENSSVTVTDGELTDEENLTISEESEKSKKLRRTRKKDQNTVTAPEEKTEEKKVTRRRRTKKQIDNVVDQESPAVSSDEDGDAFVTDGDDDSNEQDMDLEIDEGEDISYTYSWPPLVCCFGATQHAFIPSGRRANRLIDNEWHERHKDVLWDPEKFVRSPGGCASNVAVALACLGGKVAVMGKLGDDDYGQSLLYFLNINNVQTRSIRIDTKRVTAVSHMKMSKRGGLRMTCVKSCPEDSLSKSEINIDVLKEAKMFYFNTFSLLDRDMRASTMHAIKVSKKLGGVIFYDLNLPLPLWQSSEETKKFIRKAWDLADIIEVTKQELEFLCDIKATEKFDTKDNDRTKFIHYPPEVLAPLWHENLKVLFVTNGTSKIHYYTKEHNGSVLGMEDPPVTPYTSDMSASGDGIVAGILRMLSVQPHLITDKKYLERTVNYAISCGVMDQWLQARKLGYPAKEGMEEDVIPDSHGIRSVTEREYRTLVPVR